MVFNKEHLTPQGFATILGIQTSLNTGRTWIANWDFCQSVSLTRIINIAWLIGFLDAEGCFSLHLSINKHVQLQYSIEFKQATHDVSILEQIQGFLNAGNIYPVRSDNSSSAALQVIKVSVLKVRNISDIERIINLINSFPLLTRKHLDFLDFVKAINMYKSGVYKTPEGILSIKAILDNMNSKRDK